jgi:hypothetical protein
MGRKHVRSCLALMFILWATAATASPIPNIPPGVDLPFFLGEPAEAHNLPPKNIPVNPYLAPQSSIHVDMYNTGVTDLATPLGYDPVVGSRSFGPFIGMCLNFFYDAQENLFAFCGEMPGGLLGGVIDFNLTWMDPHDLSKKASLKLLSFTYLDLLSIPLEFGYMNLDADGRLISISEQNEILFVGLDDTEPQPQLAVLDSWDMSQIANPATDRIATFVPDFDGNYWFMTLGETDQDGNVTRSALVGVYGPDAPAGDVHVFDGEIIENGLAIGEEGVYAVTDHAIYGLQLNGSTVEVAWRETYDRATSLKPGVISYGSGATPTLTGDDLVAITDNADDRINLLVYHRQPDHQGERLICKVPLFPEGKSANENSVIGYYDSFIVQNWYGAADQLIFGDQRRLEPGVWRIDVREDRSGCDVIWENNEVGTPGTMKMSSASGLIYGTALEKSVTEVDAWYLAAIDYVTGETVYKVLMGYGPYSDILFIPTYFGPTGAVYQPVINGVIAMDDGSEPPAQDDDDDTPEPGIDDDDDDSPEPGDEPGNDEDSSDEEDDGCGC